MEVWDPRTSHMLDALGGQRTRKNNLQPPGRLENLTTCQKIQGTRQLRWKKIIAGKQIYPKDLCKFHGFSWIPPNVMDFHRFLSIFFDS